MKNFGLIAVAKFVTGSVLYKAKGEKPHPVTITRPFHLGMYEVTQNE